MFACLDVHYHQHSGTAACLLFPHISDPKPAETIVASLTSTAAYVPGEFYKRELPILLKVLSKATTPIDVAIIDSYVDLADNKPGLGRYLYRALEEKTAVIGVAKSRFRQAAAVELLRGRSQSPLFVTAAGLPQTEAAGLIKQMHGPYRLPTLLKQVDSTCRRAAKSL